ncbi:putative RNA-directed DNA polymerase [Rosa chinensis]|uniref:Putative RNA-directed DNA polymerase n=1 Tax=Rosa chinensis TaxID=74649 RepID=A0A2P6PFJ6_ROSCH|nr:putative RNA-directed DNA polymerase [Rosa chinensis]
MESVMVNYFEQMYKAGTIDTEALEETLQAISPSVTEEMNISLCSQYSCEEVKEALFQMYPTKSPRPDGMPPLFFQHYWESIGADITAAVHNFLQTGQLLKQINFTHICLIPTVNSPETMADLHPITLCNVIYKLCSKVIANRLKVILPQIISPFQSAFIPGRLITDNTLAANKLAHFIHNKRAGEEFMALKLDLSKAYDRLEWG